MVLPRTGADGAAEAAERLRAGCGRAAPPASPSGEPGDTAADVVAAAERLLTASVRLGGNHTRGPEADVLVDGEPRLGVTAFIQLVRLAGAVDGVIGSRPRTRSRSPASPAISRSSSSSKPDAVAASYLGGLLHALGTLGSDEVDLHRAAGHARPSAHRSPWLSHDRPGHRRALLVAAWVEPGIPVDMGWSFETRADLEAVVRIEFAPEVAEAFIASHEGTDVDYAVNVWWRRY